MLYLNTQKITLDEFEFALFQLICMYVSKVNDMA